MRGTDTAKKVVRGGFRRHAAGYSRLTRALCSRAHEVLDVAIVCSKRRFAPCKHAASGTAGW